MSDRDSHFYEDELQRHEKRESRAERKFLRSKDRSQYKKSDIDQQRKQEVPLEYKTGTLRGRIISVTGETINVVDENNLPVTCVLKGSFKQDLQRLKNPVVVGDFVRFIPSDTGDGFIVDIEPRKTFLSRADNLSQKKEHLIAANIDQVLITVSILQPSLKIPIIDRYIIAAKKGGMEPIVIVNKIDLLENEEAEYEKILFEEATKAYAIAGVTFLGVSASTDQGIKELQKLMQEKVSVFSGQSGVGKTSLINTLTGSTFATREGVERTGKGAHTTTKAQLLPLKKGGWVIDTPGIRSFGLWNLQKEDIASYFKEFQNEAAKCKFANCTHTHEQECAVIAAVEDGVIHSLRYDSYCALLEQIDEKHLRR